MQRTVLGLCICELEDTGLRAGQRAVSALPILHHCTALEQEASQQNLLGRVRRCVGGAAVFGRKHSLAER
jgi:hypothetical protein